MLTLESIPTNIITGFLGVGKTTAILHLLNTKPVGERWAVLVNEFGKVGVDGSLFKSSTDRETHVFIQEIPGGCMCCASGLPITVALNRLLKTARPQRLLIEPSGLGHPQEVLKTLTSKHYQQVLDLRATITLIDARHLHNPRYTSHETYQQQIAIADRIVANKSEMYCDNDRDRLFAYHEENSFPQQTVSLTSLGKLDWQWLNQPSHYNSSLHELDNPVILQPESIDQPDQASQLLANKEYLRCDQHGEGFVSCGWQFPPQIIFNRILLVAFLNKLNVERIKALFITNAGVYAYNKSPDALAETACHNCQESRIEIIATETDKQWEQDILDCRMNQSIKLDSTNQSLE